MNVELLIRPEAPADRAAIREVHVAAFGSSAEADLVDVLRATGDAAISLAAERDGCILGHLLFSPLLLITAEDTRPSLALAPLAVRPEAQRTGVGSALMNAGLETARDQQHTSVFVLGHPEYYPKFGFTAELATPWESPFGSGPAWMACELQPGSLQGLSGRVEYAKAFQE